MIHNFDHSVHFEREQTTDTDKFYREVLNVSEIRRFNSGSDADLEMQRQDVDVLLTINGTNYRVSEKFRDKDFGDLYVEVYRKYPGTLGWIHTGTPNAILYFTPKAVYWITYESLSAFCLQILFPLIPDTSYEALTRSNNNLISEPILLNGEVIHLNLIQAQNDPSQGGNLVTIGVSAAFSVFEMNGVMIKRICLNSI